MSLTLKQSQAIRQVATVLYSFLPGSGSASWRGHVSFSSLARDMKIAEFWVGGSKEPAIAMLLEQTLDKRPERFEPLIIAIVRHGLTYRQKQGGPIKRDEIEALNGLMLEIGFKFPELWSAEFLDSLSIDALERARQTAAAMQTTDKVKEASQRNTLYNLRSRFYVLSAERDRQAAGYELEKLLNELFGLFNLEPRPPFRVTGEQIDGSFLLDYETYIVEVKWHQQPTSESDLLSFRGKIEGKSAFTRGVFISLNGFSLEAIEAIVKGKQPTFFLMDGYDLAMVLESNLKLPDLLRFKLRKLTEEGAVFISAKQISTFSDRLSKEEGCNG